MAKANKASGGVSSSDQANLTSQTVNKIIESAIKARASDIHLEPRPDYTLVRYRIDGWLKEANKLPGDKHAALVSQLKVLAGLKVNRHQTLQTSRFKFEVDGQTYALLLSSLPILDGEKIVLRILTESAEAPTLEQLGFWGVALKNIQQAITEPRGLVLVTGPAGSGKSTILFSLLSSLSRAGVNISTIEDPIEYRIAGVNQVQVEPGSDITLPSGFKALLDQDSDVIMLSAIRDSDTANLAIQAALTRNLVFSALHAKSATAGLAQLEAMGLEPHLLASSLKLIIAGRLVRRLCPSCRQSFVPTTKQLDQLSQDFDLDEQASFTQINESEQAALSEGLGSNGATSELSSSPTTIKRLFKASHDGCSHCNYTGFSGRLGLYEVLHVSDAIQKLIVTKAQTSEIEASAQADGLLTLGRDGLVKALRGLTTLEEVLKVTT